MARARFQFNTLVTNTPVTSGGHDVEAGSDFSRHQRAATGTGGSACCAQDFWKREGEPISALMTPDPCHSGRAPWGNIELQVSDLKHCARHHDPMPVTIARPRASHTTRHSYRLPQPAAESILAGSVAVLSALALAGAAHADTTYDVRPFICRRSSLYPLHTS